MAVGPWENHYLGQGSIEANGKKANKGQCFEKKEVISNFKLQLETYHDPLDHNQVFLERERESVHVCYERVLYCIQLVRCKS